MEDQAPVAAVVCSSQVAPESLETYITPPVTVAANLVPSAELVIEVQARLPEPVCSCQVTPASFEV